MLNIIISNNKMKRLLNSFKPILLIMLIHYISCTRVALESKTLGMEDLGTNSLFRGDFASCSVITDCFNCTL